MKNKISQLGLEGVVLGLVGQGKNHREIAKTLKAMGHEVTPSQVYGFTSKISPDERNLVMQQFKAAEITSLEALEKTATRVLQKMEALLDTTIEHEGSKGFMAITSFSNQLGAWLDRLIKLKAKQPDQVTIQVQYVINNFQVVFDTIQDVLLSNDEWVEAYAAIDDRLKQRLGANWGRVDLTQPSAVAALEPMPDQELAAVKEAKKVQPDGDLSAGTINPANQVGRRKKAKKVATNDTRQGRAGCKGTVGKDEGKGSGHKKGSTDDRRTAKDGKAARSVAARRMPKVQGPHDHKA